MIHLYPRGYGQRSRSHAAATRLKRNIGRSTISRGFASLFLVLATTYSKFDALSLPASALFFFSIHLHTSELQNFYDLLEIVLHCDFDPTKRSVREDTAIPSMITLRDPHLSVHHRSLSQPLQNAVVLISPKLPPSRYCSLCL